MDHARARASSPDTPGSDGRGLLRFTEIHLARRSPALVLSVAGVLVSGITAADVATGPDPSLSLFYLVPVALVSWRLGVFAGVAAAGVVALAWTFADVRSSAYDLESPAAVWNSIVRFGVLDVVAVLLAALHAGTRAQRELMRGAVESAEQLRSLNELKDTLLHAVSHDLRGPIAAIVGSASSLERSERLALSAHDEAVLIDGILQSGRKLNRMVCDLLDLERLDRGVIEPDRAPTELGALVHRVVDEAIYADQHPIHVEVLEPVRLNVDAGKIERVVENLLVNAVKHTPARTPIVIRVRRREAGAMISVEDEGPGVPDELKTVIFQPFRRGDGAQSGSGIGLSVVAKFAELHGGRAWVEDRPGGAAAFHVLLSDGPAEPSAP